MATTNSIDGDIVKRAIVQIKEEIKRKRERIRTMPALIQKLRGELATLESELETDLAQLRAFEEQSTATGGHISVDAAPPSQGARWLWGLLPDLRRPTLPHAPTALPPP
ncbi:hypothetical protein LJR130_005120 [Variovorax sp. LjRoot130]|uniref:hypothetical protein n=1 Tax=Variovorax sp. LjRoot130 TaxID=3342261 RepID=UPI003ECD11A5